MLLGAASSSGIRVTPLKALGVATVYACVSVLSRTISTLPIHVYRRTADGGKEPAPDHPVYDLIHNEPNRWTSSTDFREAMQQHLSLRNKAVAIIMRTRGGDIDSLVPVHPSDIQKIEITPMQDLVYTICGEKYLDEEIIHLKQMTGDGITSSDLIRTVNDVLGLAIALEENASKFFKNNSKPGGMLSHPSSLSDRAFERLRDEMENKHAGVENAYKLMILEEGLKYEASRTDNKDAQFDESRDRQDKAIARIFGVPPHKLGLVNSMPRSNVEQENISFVVETIRPICVKWEQTLNRKLLSREERRQYFIEFNLEGLLRGDIATRFEAYSKARQWGWLSVNEIRKKENLNPIGDQGDVYLQPMNMSSAGEPEGDN